MTPEQVTAALAGDLPPATLVLGPGAWPLVVVAADGRSGWAVRPALDAAGARLLRADAHLRSATGPRVFLVCLDGVSAAVQNMLLKVLEETPPDARFILAAAVRPLPTVVSRCQVLALGGGEVGSAPDARDKAVVGTAIKAARAGQSPLLSQTVRGWQPAHARLLTAWAAEVVTGRWLVFDPAFAPGVSRAQALRLMTELARWPGSRLGPVVALDLVFRPG
jgi:hypothetical protein